MGRHYPIEQDFEASLREDSELISGTSSFDELDDELDEGTGGGR